MQPQIGAVGKLRQPLTGAGTLPSGARLLPLLSGFAFASYLLRMNISVAQQYMAPELGLTDVQVGQIFSAFMLGYALFQVPAGMWGDRFGPRLVLAAAGVVGTITTLLTGLIPGGLVKGAAASFLALLVLRFALGVGEAATYPVAAKAVALWLPPSRHAFSNGMVIAGSTLGSAFTAPLIAHLMQRQGWRASFYWTALVPLVIVVLWWRSVPKHFSSRDPVAAAAEPWWRLFRNRDLAFLSVSYFLDSYVLFLFVFWLFKYLVEVRRFSVISGGWATSLPFALATLAVPAFGYLSDHLSRRFQGVSGRRVVAMGCLVASGTLLLLGAWAPTAWAALAAISLSVAFLLSTEGPYWANAIDLSADNAGAAGGLMNMAGNLGGVVSTAIMPVLVHAFGWFGALASGSLFALLGAGFWLFIPLRRRAANAPVR